jgi:hypothetical protein
MVETAKIAMEKKGEEYTEEHDKLGRIVLRTKLKDKAPVSKYKIQVRATR